MDDQQILAQSKNLNRLCSDFIEGDLASNSQLKKINKLLRNNTSSSPNIHLRRKNQASSHRPLDSTSNSKVNTAYTNADKNNPSYEELLITIQHLNLKIDDLSNQLKIQNQKLSSRSMNYPISNNPFNVLADLDTEETGS